jgi:SAM-dependent methyltransferase
MASQASTYDQVIYPSRPQPATHPDGLAALGLLFGLSPAPVERSRVLEIGCATGGNLFGLAEAYPEAEFVGIDPSPRQIDIARQAAGSVGLPNLRLEVLKAGDLPDEWGPFDYILCHGVYSWVSPDARAGILDACRRLLAPDGIAYVSYNAKPGWYLRQPVREMLWFHSRDIQDLPGRIAQSRTLLQFVAAHATNPGTGWAHLLREEADLLGSHSDGYLAHEHLEGENEAFYFRDFVDAARRHDLEYLCEAASHSNPAALPAEALRALEDTAGDLVTLEQYLDFLRGRMFRRTLLVHQGAPINRAPTPDILDRLHLSALVRPDAREVDVCSDQAVKFRNDDDDSLQTNDPALKAALMELFFHKPAALSWAELWRRTAGRLQGGGVELAEQGRAALAARLLSLFLVNVVAFHAGPTRFTLEPGERPVASRLARLQAGAGAPVCNRRHRTTDLDPFALALLTLLDGTRDQRALAEELSRRASPPVPAEALAPEIGPALAHLARSAVLVA